MMQITLNKRPAWGKRADERNSALCEAYRSGMDVRACMEKFELGRERVYQILRRNGMALHKTRPSLRGAQGSVLASQEDQNAEYLAAISPFELSLRASGSRRSFDLLDERSQMVVKALFARHEKACESLGVDIDPYYLPDAILEVRRFIKLREKQTVNN
jgi:transposase